MINEEELLSNTYPTVETQNTELDHLNNYSSANQLEQDHEVKSIFKNRPKNLTKLEELGS